MTPTEYECKIRNAMRNYHLPDYMQEGVVKYLVHRIRPGSFLQALFSNQLKESYTTADINNTRDMQTWVHFMYNEMPMNAQGSPEIYEAWLKKEDSE